MATATIVSGFTVLSNCDATTGWSAATLDTEVLRQGTASCSGILRTTGLNARTFATTNLNLTNQHLRIWLNYASIGFLTSQATGGIRLQVTSPSGTGYWYVGGNDTYGGGWELFTVDCNRPFDSGTSTLTGITSVGFSLNLSGAPRNAVNTWWDFLIYGNGYSVTGGTAGDPITMADIFTADTTNGFGMVRRINSVYFVNSALTIGGATNTYFSDDSQVIVFENQPVATTLYRLQTGGSGAATTGMVLTNSVVKSASSTTRATVAFNNANQNVGTYTGNSFQTLNTIAFKAGQTITGNVFQNCNRITPLTATFNNNTVALSPDVTGALLWPGGTTVTNCEFTSNSRAIAITANGTYTFDGLTFSGNTFDVINSSTGSTTVNAINNSNPSTVTNTAGGTLTFVNAKSFTITNIISGSEIRIYRSSDSVELGGVEVVSSSPSGVNGVSVTSDPDNAGRFRVNYSYNYTSDTPIFVVCFNVSYLPIQQPSVLRSTDNSISVNQIFDRQYV